LSDFVGRVGAIVTAPPSVPPISSQENPMSEPLPPWLANLDPRWLRPDWKNWARPDWRRFMPPGASFEAKPAPRSEFERLYRPYRDEPPVAPQAPRNDGVGSD
jgi:hypothetical protein